MTFTMWVGAYFAVGFAVLVALQWHPDSITRLTSQVAWPLVILMWPILGPIELLSALGINRWLESIGRNNDPV